MLVINHVTAGGGGSASLAPCGNTFQLNSGTVQRREPLGTSADSDRSSAAAEPDRVAPDQQRRARMLFNLQALVELDTER